MSAHARATVLPGLSPRPSASTAERAERPGVRAISFGALGLYGVLRWGTLITPAPTGRLLGLLALALLLVMGGGRLAARGWPLALAAAVVAVLAMFPICGVPLSWVTHARVAVTANAIGEGLSSLPGVLLPYAGINPWSHLVILLGAGILLLDGAFALAFAGGAVSDLRRAGAALPLIALVVVPSTLLHPRLPYVQGLLLFGLTAAFMWGERVGRGNAAAAVVLCALAGVGGMIFGPGLDQHKPWVDYESLAGGLAPSRVDAFDWSQTYGPVNWPRRGREVLDVVAKRPDYWKAENLDVFDGTRWVAGSSTPFTALTGVDAGALSRWTQTLQVTIRTMKTTTILAAGAASRPADVSAPVLPGASSGTWITTTPLAPGDSYAVRVYSPRPTAWQLSGAGDHYPYLIGGYDTIELRSPGGAPIGVRFPPFHSGRPALTGLFLDEPDGAAVMRQSPYVRAYALATRLARRAKTPYAFVQSVTRYLTVGFSYDENPPQSTYPLESFLFQSKLGYCQQFAGAMALLLRMGGVPARVAAGFTPGTYKSATHAWAVTDIDAHAWVEVWFPHYGWVRFDPTPPGDPALGGRSPVTAATDTGAAAPLPHGLDGASSRPAHAAHSAAAARRRGLSALLVIALVAAALAAAALGLALWRAGRARSEEELLAELERAMRRLGRPLGAGTTLTVLERRVRGRPRAEAYIRMLRLTRFAGASALPTLRQRRALRAELCSGLGLRGAVRALWALPPRWAPPRTRSHARPGA